MERAGSSLTFLPPTQTCMTPSRRTPPQNDEGRVVGEHPRLAIELRQTAVHVERVREVAVVFPELVHHRNFEHTVRAGDQRGDVACGESGTDIESRREAVDRARREKTITEIRRRIL